MSTLVQTTAANTALFLLVVWLGIMVFTQSKDSMADSLYTHASTPMHVTTRAGAQVQPMVAYVRASVPFNGGALPNMVVRSEGSATPGYVRTKFAKSLSTSKVKDSFFGTFAPLCAFLGVVAAGALWVQRKRKRSSAYLDLWDIGVADYDAVAMAASSGIAYRC